MTSWKYSKYCTVTLFSHSTCRSRSTAVQGELQSGGQSWCLSRRIWWGESNKSRFSLACHHFHVFQSSRLPFPQLHPDVSWWTLGALFLPAYVHWAACRADDYHCTNVAHAQNTMSRVPLNGLWQAWVWLVFLNTESAWMTDEFLHLHWIVFIVVVAISGIQLSPWEPVYLYSTVSDHCKIPDFLQFALWCLSSGFMSHTTSVPCWCGMDMQDKQLYSRQQRETNNSSPLEYSCIMLFRILISEVKRVFTYCILRAFPHEQIEK